jgi:hypothetical protein
MTSMEDNENSIFVDPITVIWRPDLKLMSNEFHVRFGSKADICSATSHVRFAPNSDRKSGH